jgi:hypothetical protein
MPNTQAQFNPAYSTIKSIVLSSNFNRSNTSDINMLEQNTLCRFERLETVENINDVFPSGAVLVKDFSDIVSYIAINEIKYVLITFFNGDKWTGYITSTSYNNNAATDGDDTLVVINFTNSYYQYFSSNTLTSLLGYKKPLVFLVDEFVSLMRNWVFGTTKGYQDSADNYFLYRPLIPFNDREEALPDNAIELMNYLATSAVSKQNKNPYFMFWTSFGGAVNFKYFDKNPTKDPSFATINQNYRNIGIYNGDSVVQKLSDGKTYRKAYFFATNPAFQWISKNYYYIRKTPKYLDSLSGVSGSSGISAGSDALKNLTFHFQDDGQKYNVDVVSILGRGTDAPKGGDLIHSENTWGYYDGENPTNNRSSTNLLSNQYGTNNSYKSLSLMGVSGFMPFLDSPDMWKNMFDLTPIHPHYPDESSISPGATFAGAGTNLQKVMDIRYNTFMGIGISGASGGSSGTSGTDRLEQIRQIEAQNFVMYSLCCMGKKEDCFFAVLQRYEPDTAYYAGLSGSSGGSSSSGVSGPTFSNDAKFYRYKWNKITFNGNTGSSGLTGESGASGSSGGGTYSAHQLEKWQLDPTVKSNGTQDNTWAINLNERGLTAGYLPPGWVATTTGSFDFRPIGAGSGASFSTSADIMHIARVCVEQVDAENSVAYFWAENIVDGEC